MRDHTREGEPVESRRGSAPKTRDTGGFYTGQPRVSACGKKIRKVSGVRFAGVWLPGMWLLVWGLVILGILAVGVVSKSTDLAVVQGHGSTAAQLPWCVDETRIVP